MVLWLSRKQDDCMLGHNNCVRFNLTEGVSLLQRVKFLIVYVKTERVSQLIFIYRKLSGKSAMPNLDVASVTCLS